MQQRLECSLLIEVPGLTPLQNIRTKAGSSGGLFAEFPKLVRCQGDRPIQEASREDNDQRREYAPESPGVESTVPEAPASQIFQYETRDQESRDHEEDIDAREATVHRVREGVIADDAEYCDRAQAVDVGSIPESGLHAATFTTVGAGSPA